MPLRQTVGSVPNHSHPETGTNASTDTAGPFTADPVLEVLRQLAAREPARCADPHGGERVVRDDQRSETDQRRRGTDRSHGRHRSRITRAARAADARPYSILSTFCTTRPI